MVSGGVEREVKKAVGVWIVGGRSWEREAKSLIEAVLNDVRVRRCQEGNEAGRNMASNGGYSAP